jgi:hypothetical protein
MPRLSPRLLTGLATLPGLAVVAVQAAWAWPFFSDDSFISLRFAARLLAGQGLTWTEGERVEGYSNLAWVLATAGLGALGLDLITAARLLGALATAFALWQLAALAAPRNGPGVLRAAVAPLLVGSAAPLAGWTLGGLEGPLVLACLATGGAALVQHHRGERPLRHAAGLPFAVLCLTRPDGPLWVAMALLGLGRAGLRLLPWTAAAVLGQLVFRLGYYGAWVPNTAHLKVDPSWASLRMGLDYVRGAAWTTAGLWLPALLGSAIAAWRQPAWRRALATGWLPPLAWAGYLATVGGDHFPGHRLWLPALAPLGVLLAAVLPRGGWRGTALLAALGVAGAGANLWLARTDPATAHLRGDTFQWRGLVLGTALQRAFGAAQPLLAVEAAGALPYAAELPALDLLGLCDRTIARTPVPAWAPAVGARAGLVRPQGHLHGNGRYAMDRAPDLMLFGPPPGMPLVLFVSGIEFEADPRFLDGYRCVHVDLGQVEVRPGQRETLRAPLWTRVEGRVGVQRAADRVEVPAYLFGAYRQPRAFRLLTAPPAPDAADFAAWQQDLLAAGAWFRADGPCHAFAVPASDGALELELRGPEPAALQCELPAGRWQCAVEPAAAAVAVQVDGAATANGTWVWPEAGPHQMSLVARGATAAAPVRVQRLVLRRQ